jgi:hypothetical protein
MAAPTNPAYDEIISTARDDAYAITKLEVSETHPASTGTPLNAFVANEWNKTQYDRTRDELTATGYPPGSDVQSYYESNWVPPPATDNRSTRPVGGDTPPPVLPLPVASTIPGVGETPSSRMDEGIQLANLPYELHEMAFITVDTDSFGGRKWKERANQAGYDITLKFQFLGSSEFSDSVAANYATHDVLGRSESYYSYERTSNREFSLALKFVAQGLYGDDPDSVTQEVKARVDWCRALAYPCYSGGLMYPPPAVYVGFGNMFVRKGKTLRCLVTNVNVTYNTDDAPMDLDKLAPYTALVDISFVGAHILDARSSMLDAGTILSGDF